MPKKKQEAGFPVVWAISRESSGPPKRGENTVSLSFFPPIKKAVARIEAVRRRSG